MSGYQAESAERQAALRRKMDTAESREARAPEHPLLTLQSQIGNAHVARLLAQRAEAEEEEPLQAKHDQSVQRAAEEEEEPLQAKHDVSLQRAAEEEEEPVQASHDLAQREEEAEHVGIEGGPVGPDTEQRIQAARGGGSGLDSSTQASMESSFGTSFADVRVHQDSESDLLTRRLTSHAFTTGSDIFLRGDASGSDNHLIAHELTHVVQQRSMGGGGATTVGAAGDTHEHSADATADAVLSGASAPVAASPAGAQRAADEDELQAKHDLAQREAEEDDVMADHDLSLQRETDDGDS